MQIKFDMEIARSDEAPLAAALGCSVANLGTELQGHAQAALREYIDCYLGRRVFTRGSDILEYRLALLTLHAFEGSLPDEVQIANLFQKTPSASRTLIRNSLSKYRYQLEAAIQDSAKVVLEKVKWAVRDVEGVYHAYPVSQNMIEILNRQLVAIDPTLKPIALVPNSAATYEIDLVAYENLCKSFGARKVASK